MFRVVDGGRPDGPRTPSRSRCQFLKEVGGRDDAVLGCEAGKRDSPQEGDAPSAPVIEGLRSQPVARGNDIGADRVDEVAMGMPLGVEPVDKLAMRVLLHAAFVNDMFMTRKPTSLMEPMLPFGLKGGAMNNFVGDRIRDRVEALGISQAQAARNVDMSPQRFGQYVNGKRQLTPDMLAKIARGLQTTPNALLGFNDADSDEMLFAILVRLAELEGLSAERSEVLAQFAVEALRLARTLPDDGDPLLRSRLAAQAAWQLKGSGKPVQ